MTQQRIRHHLAGDLAHGVVRGAQRFGGEVQGLAPQFVACLDGVVAGTGQRLDVAAARREGALAGKGVGTGHRAQCGMQRGQPRTGAGLPALHAALRAMAGADAFAGEGAFTARSRHVQALARARDHAIEARDELRRETLDLAAEALRAAHDAVGEITGKVVPDALLGHIFASFCIGK